jgi:hypothetical protein
MKIILIILLILLILIFILLINKKENYTDNNKNKNKKSKTISDSIIKGSDPLEGQLFDDVIMYNGDKTLQGELGLEKCIKKCDGMCVEYGMTGDAFCFPKNSDEKKFTKTIQSELKTKLI